ncbi:MAG: GNAT family N-acetyltransferase [Maritimibacter sp.]
MTKPIHLPNAETLLEVCEATWPPVSTTRLGAWTIREGGGGGKRVSAATEDWPVTDADLPTAEAAMRDLGQVPLFQIRADEEKLDSLLDAHGYSVIDPVNLWAAPVSLLTTRDLPQNSVEAIWPPQAYLSEIWQEGGIGTERQAVMARAKVAKTSIVARLGGHAAGVAFVGLHEDVAMVHALHVAENHRRRGAARMLMQAAANWAADQGAEVISLIVTQGNHAANPLYASLGMNMIGHYHYRILPDQAQK